MKRGAPNHPKMKSLARALNVPLPMAVGMMEMLWHFAGQYTPAGDIGKFDDHHLEEEAGWIEKKRAGHLIQALIQIKWIEVNERHRLILHDWPEHCDDGVHMKLARSREMFADGSIPKTNRLPKAERESADSHYAASTPDNRAHLVQSQAHGVRTESALNCGSQALALALAEPSRAEPSGDGRAEAAQQPRSALFPIAPLPDDEPDRSALAVSAVDAMLKQHWVVSNRAQSIWEVEQILLKAVHPERAIEAMQRNHGEHVQYRRKHPQCKRSPPLQFWIRDGDYLHGPPNEDSTEPDDKVAQAMKLFAERTRRVKPSGQGITAGN